MTTETFSEEHEQGAVERAERTLKKSGRTVLWFCLVLGYCIFSFLVQGIYGQKHIGVEAVVDTVFLTLLSGIVLFLFSSLSHFIREYGSRLSLAISIVTVYLISSLIVVAMYANLERLTIWNALAAGFAAIIMIKATGMRKGFRAIKTLRANSFFQKTESRNLRLAGKTLKQVSIHFVFLGVIILVILVLVVAPLTSIPDVPRTSYQTEHIDRLSKGIVTFAIILGILAVTHMAVALYISVIESRLSMWIGLSVIVVSIIFGGYAIYMASWEPWYEKIIRGMNPSHEKLIGFLILSVLLALPILRGFVAVRTLEKVADSVESEMNTGETRSET